MEIFKYKSNLISFLLFFVLGAHVSFGQGENKVFFSLPGSQTEYTWSLNTDQQLSLSVNYEFTCPDQDLTHYTLKIDLPQEINTSEVIIIGVGGAKLIRNIDNSLNLNQILLEVPLVEVTNISNPDDKLYKHNLIITLQKFKAPGWACATNQRDLSVELFTCNQELPTHKDDVKLNIINNENLDLRLSAEKFNCIYGRPFHIRLNAKAENTEVFSDNGSHKINYKVTYGDERFKCIGVTRTYGYGKNGAYMNAQQLEFKDVNGTVTFTRTIGNKNFSWEEYKMYFTNRKGEAVIEVNESLAIKAQATITRDNCPDLISQETSLGVQFKDNRCVQPTTDKNAYSNSPDILTYFRKACNSNVCNEDIAQNDIQFDNSFYDGEVNHKPKEYNNVAYKIKIGNEVKVTGFKIYNDWFSQNDENFKQNKVKLYFRKSSDAADDALHEIVADFSQQLPKFKLLDDFQVDESSERITEIILYTPKIISNYSSPPFWIYTALTSSVVSSPGDLLGKKMQLTMVKDFSKNNLSSQVILKQRTESLPEESSKECSLYSLGEMMYWKDLNFFTAHRNIDTRDTDYQTILLKLNYSGKNDNYSFKYNLNDILFNVKTISNFKFHNGFFDTSKDKDAPNGFHDLFLSKGDFLNQNSSFTGFNCEPDLESSPGEVFINVTKLPLNSADCNSENFWVAFDVKYNKNPTHGHYTSNKRYTFSDYNYRYENQFNPKRVIWKVVPFSSFENNIFASCDDASKSGSKDIKLKPGDDFSYYYEVMNTSNANYRELINIGVFPYSGDFETRLGSAKNRGSNINLEGSLDIEISVLDIEGNDASEDNPISNGDFTISYAPLTGSQKVCLDGSDDMVPNGNPPSETNCEAPQWQNTCPASGPFAFKISTKTFELKPNNSLVFTIKSKIPETALYGDVLYADFASQYTEYSNARINIETSSHSKIRIAEFSSCDPCPTCITSFKPSPGEEYVVGAWVKESKSRSVASVEFYDYPGYSENAVNYSPLILNVNRPVIGKMLLYGNLGNVIPGAKIAQEMVNKINSTSDGYYAEMNTDLCPSCVLITTERISNNLKLSSFSEYDADGNDNSTPAIKIISQFKTEHDYTDYINYDSPILRVQVGVQQYDFKAKGPIVDGWQRISEVITIPSDGQKLIVELLNEGDHNVWFDDVRFQPFNSSMVTYVYDTETYQLVAELDDENFKTEYIYDMDGNLVRTNVETTDGVRTVSESRSHVQKRQTSTTGGNTTTTTSTNTGWINQIINVVRK